MPPLTPELRASQTWMGRQSALLTTLEPQQLCNVQLPEDMARPWLLTVYAQTINGDLTVPTNPVGPSSGVGPVYARTTCPAALRVRIGADVVTMDYPRRGATYAVSPCAQVNVALVAGFAGIVPPAPTDLPSYSARLTEAEGSGMQAPLHTPRYTYQLGGLPVGATVWGLVPVRANTLTLYPGDLAGAGTELMTLTWLDDNGANIAKNSIKPGPAVGADGPQLTQWVIPGGATQWSLQLLGVEDCEPSLVFGLAL